MKRTTTEIFIEIEETIRVKAAGGKATKSREIAAENSNPVIEICPHCGQAIFESQIIEPKGEKQL